MRKTHPETIPLTTDVCTWPLADVATVAPDVRFRGKVDLTDLGVHALVMAQTEFG